MVGMVLVQHVQHMHEGECLFRWTRTESGWVGIGSIYSGHTYIHTYMRASLFMLYLHTKINYSILCTVPYSPYLFHGIRERQKTPKRGAMQSPARVRLSTAACRIRYRKENKTESLSPKLCFNRIHRPCLQLCRLASRYHPYISCSWSGRCVAAHERPFINQSKLMTGYLDGEGEIVIRYVRIYGTQRSGWSISGQAPESVQVYKERRVSR